MKKKLLYLIILILASSCASKKVTKEINEEIAKTPIIRSEKELYQIEKNDLLSSTNLTNDQRKQLTTLLENSEKESLDLQNKIEKTKAVLFKELLSTNENKYKIKLLESELLKLNKKRTRYSLNKYREAKNIVGKNDIPLERTLMMIDRNSFHDY